MYIHSSSYLTLPSLTFHALLFYLCSRYDSDDSDDSIDLKSQTSIRGVDAKAKNILGNSYSNNNSYSSHSGDKRYDSEDVSPEGTLTIKQPVRSNMRRNMNGFVPKDLKPKFEVTTTSSVMQSQLQPPNKKGDGEGITSWMMAPKKFLDESKGPMPSNNQDLLVVKNKKPAISANIIIKSSNRNSKSNIKSFDSSFQSTSDSIPIDDDADDTHSQESSNTVDDFSNIAIDKTPRLNTTKKPGQVRYAFDLSPTADDPYLASPSTKYKNKSGTSAMVGYKEKSASFLNKENISTEVDDDGDGDGDDFAVIDESADGYVDKQDHEAEEEGSDHTLDPSVVKPGEFYTDFVDKSIRSLKPPRSSDFDESELDYSEIYKQEQSEHRKNSLKPTIFAKNNRANAPPFPGQPGIVKTSWISVSNDNAADISSRHSFVQVAHSKGAKSERVHCTVVRDKRATIQGKMSPSYVLILEDTNKPIIVAQKLSLTRTSNYHLFDMTRAQLSKVLSKKSGNYLGKLRATNVNRTEYVLLNQNSEREEIAGIKFDRLTLMDQLKDGNQPRKLKAILPLLNKDKVPIPNKVHDSSGSGSLSEKMHKYELNSGVEIDDALVFESKDPVYENGNFRLNFSGRVHMPSVKNFQLVSKSDIADVICQFGKVDEDIFHLDFKAPMNACQAFSLALCQFNL